jgi:hypothetical protein
MGTTPGRAFLDRRIDLITSGQVDAMVDEGYNDDAVLVSFDGQIQGKEALRAHFRRHMPDMGGVQLKSVDKFAETDDAIFVEVTVISGAYGEVTSYEAFVLRDGKADHHFTLLKQ